MSGLLGTLGAVLVGPLSGLITTRLMDVIDDGLKITSAWPDTIKQLLVMALAALLPIANAQWHLTLPTDPSLVLTQPTVQYVVGIVLAFVFKHGSTASKTAAVVNTVASSAGSGK